MADPDVALLRLLDDYVAGLFAPEDAALVAAREAARAGGLPPIEVSATEGRLLAVLLGLIGARRVLEIGTLGGYSAIWMARALPVDGRLVTLEIDPRHAEVARRNVARAGLADRVEIRVGRALDLLASMPSAGADAFDAAFIDADKVSYPEYLGWCLRLVRPGGLLLADNVLRGGAVLRPESDDARAIARFNEMVAAHARLDAIAVPIARGGVDGLAIARVRA